MIRTRLTDSGDIDVGDSIELSVFGMFQHNCCLNDLINRGEERL